MGTDRTKKITASRSPSHHDYPLPFPLSVVPCPVVQTSPAPRPVVQTSPVRPVPEPPSPVRPVPEPCSPARPVPEPQIAKPGDAGNTVLLQLVIRLEANQTRLTAENASLREQLAPSKSARNETPPMDVPTQDSGALADLGSLIDTGFQSLEAELQHLHASTEETDHFVRATLSNHEQALREGLHTITSIVQAQNVEQSRNVSRTASAFGTVTREKFFDSHLSSVFTHPAIRT